MSVPLAAKGDALTCMEALIMSRNTRTQKVHQAAADQQGETVIFMRTEFIHPDTIVREGQTVRYDLERRADNRLYAINIEVIAQPALH